MPPPAAQREKDKERGNKYSHFGDEKRAGLKRFIHRVAWLVAGMYGCTVTPLDAEAYGTAQTAWYCAVY